MIIALIIGGIVIGLLFIGGFIFHGTGGPSAAPPPTASVRPGCAACVGHDIWFSSLTPIAKVFAAAWYAALKLGCLLRGC